MTAVIKKLRERTEESVERNMASAADPQQMSDVEKPARWGWRVLWIGLAAAVVWAALAPLGQGVPAQGFVKVQGSRKTIQHGKGGVIEEILVREGDQVAEGQPLLRLNEAQAQAQQGSIESQLINLTAVQARLQAERENRPSVTFPPFLQERRANPQAQEAMGVQQNLFATRRAALANDVSILTEQLQGMNRQEEAFQARARTSTEQIRLYREELAALRPAFDQGFVPRQRLFELERALTQVEGQRNEDEANLGRVRSAMGELRLRIAQARETYRKEVETQLTDIQRQVADLTERRVATIDELQRVVLKAPEAGTIVELAVHTIGGVVTPGQKLMDIVPANSKLEVEVQIPPHLIDSVRTGQLADVHFSAFEQTVVPVVEGELTYVGADRQTDPRTDAPFYVGRVTITPTGWKQIGRQRLRPGMPAEVIIKTGERSLLAYLYKPLRARVQSGLTER